MSGAVARDCDVLFESDLISRTLRHPQSARITLRSHRTAGRRRKSSTRRATNESESDVTDVGLPRVHPPKNRRAPNGTRQRTLPPDLHRTPGHTAYAPPEPDRLSSQDSDTLAVTFTDYARQPRAHSTVEGFAARHTHARSVPVDRPSRARLTRPPCLSPPSPWPTPPRPRVARRRHCQRTTRCVPSSCSAR